MTFRQPLSHSIRLGSLFTPELLERFLPQPGDWRPFPPVQDRAAWAAAHLPTREMLLSMADVTLAKSWPVLTATGYLRFRVDGDRTGFEGPYFARRDRLIAAILDAGLRGPTAERVTEITDGAWLICEESSWCVPAHSPDPLPDLDRPHVDLFAAETASLLALTDLLCGELLPGQVRQRLRNEVRQRVLAPYRARDDWWWFGITRTELNNWTPWIHANLLTASLLLDTERDEIVAGARRTVGALDRYLASVPDDGGCDEGIHYWWRAGASLFECLQTLESACGTDADAFDLPQVMAIATYPMYMHISEDWHVNFADGRPRQVGLPRLLHAFARRCGSEQVARHARALRGQDTALLRVAPTPDGSLGRILGALFDADWASAPLESFPMPGQAWFPETRVLVARERPGTAYGLFLAAKAGHNGEQHNHNDVGSFIVALDGRPLLIDVGVGGYSRQTFSDDRYQIWTMQSSWHNAPEVNGMAQVPGREFAAANVGVRLSDDVARLSMELASAYPPQAGLASWRRSLELDRTRAVVTIHDAWELTHDVGQVVLHLIAAAEPHAAADGRLVIPGDDRDLLIAYPRETLTVSIEKRPIDDPKLQASWGAAVWRVTLTANGYERRGAVRLELATAPRQ